MTKLNEKIQMIITTERENGELLTHCHFNGDMNHKEKQCIINALMKTAHKMAQGNLKDNDKERFHMNINN